MTKQVKLIYFYYLFFHHRPIQQFCFSFLQAFRRYHNILKKILLGAELQLSTAQARRQRKLQHPTRLVENVVITTKVLQERKTQLLNGTTAEKQVIKILVVSEISNLRQIKANWVEDGLIPTFAVQDPVYIGNVRLGDLQAYNMLKGVSPI